MRSGWDVLADALASLKLAVATMSALGVACIVATFYEAQHGTAAAQRVFYRSPWFNFLLALLAVNVLWSVVKRYPWDRHHTGFVLAHAGILLILGGSVYSLHAGLDGRLALVEGETGDRVSLSRESLRVRLPDGVEAEVGVAFHDRAPSPGARLPLPGTGAALVIEEYRAHVRVSETLGEGEDETAPLGPALHFTLATPFLTQDGWLMAGDPERRRASFGPVVLSFHQAAPRADTHVAPPATGSGLAFLLMPDGGLRYTLDAHGAPPSSGAVEVGRPIQTPWMQMTVTVDRLLRRAAMRRVVIRAAPPAREEERRPAVRVRLEGAGPSQAEWLAWGESRPVRAGGGRAQLAYVPAEVALPFRFTLLRFKSEKYPGSAMPATYESRVRVDDPEAGASEYLISMNNPLRHRGYIFFQSSFAEGARMTSVFSVVRSPGLPVVYLGTALLSVGVLWMFYVKPRLAKRQGRRALRERRLGTARYAL
ncbi:MAG TPA: cytochrome c biogenesis protein ResB [Vicinamibacteria bacterium]|nr:cytochrome c biogenesis protein ResB [Vicinamibacteria bacterium]